MSKNIPTVADQFNAQQPKPVEGEIKPSYPSFRFHPSGKHEVVRTPERDAELQAEGGWSDTPFPTPVKVAVAVKGVSSKPSDDVLMKQLDAAFDDIDKKFNDLNHRIDDLVLDLKNKSDAFQALSDQMKALAPPSSPSTSSPDITPKNKSK